MDDRKLDVLRLFRDTNYVWYILFDILAFGCVALVVLYRIIYNGLLQHQFKHFNSDTYVSI